MSLRDKRDALVVNMVDGAEALDKFFQQLRIDRTAEPISLAERLSAKYQLNPNQQDYFAWIAGRAEKAKAIVGHLESQFGVDGNGYFIDSKGLQRFVDKKIKPFSHPVARSYNFAIGFSGDQWRYLKTRLGFASTPKLFINGGDRMFDDLLSLPLEKVIGRAKKGISTDFRVLTFYQPSKKLIERWIREKKLTHRKQHGEEYKFLASAFGENFEALAKEEFEETEEHELRHVIQNILTPRGNYFSETPAFLFPHHKSLKGLTQDYNNLKKRFDATREKFEEMEGQPMPRVIQECNRQVVACQEAELVRVKKDFDSIRDNLKLIPPEKLRATAYLFSTLLDKKVPRRIELVADLYQGIL